MAGINCPIIGIDLGTTYSCMSVWRNDKFEVIPNAQGDRTIPSCVAFAANECLVGDAAKNQASLHPTNFIYDAKRLIGRPFSDRSVQADIKFWPFKVVAGRYEKPLISVKHGGEEKLFAAEEISSMVLTKMKDTAESHLGCAVTSAVMTVPAYFTDSQRQATIEAGSIAGLNIVRLINEPMAAALGYGLQVSTEHGLKETVLIFDLGGGTLDISLLVIEDGIIDIKAIAGDTHLGGQDFDNRLANFLVQEYSRRQSQDISKKSCAFRRLLFACEKAKRVLSTSSNATIEIDSLHEGVDFHMNITRAMFEDLNMDLFIKCVRLVEQCLSDANMQKSGIDNVFLVGGSTRIPKVQELLEDYFNGKFLPNTFELDEIVARGAAFLGLTVFLREHKFWTLPLSIGLEIGSDGFMEVMIPRNTPLPTQVVKTICVVSNDQTSVMISVWQGERSMANDNILVRKLRLNGLTCRPAHVCTIIVSFSIDSNDILHVTFEDETSKKKAFWTISYVNQRPTKEYVNLLIREAEKYKQGDEMRKRKAVRRNDLEKDTYLVCGTIKELKLRKDRSKYMKTVGEILKWLHNNGSSATLQELEERRTEIENVEMAVVTKVAAQANCGNSSLLMQLSNILARLLS